MTGPSAPEAKRSLSAETILTAAIGAVSLIVITLGVLLWAAERNHRNEEAVVERVRAARSELIEASQARYEAEAIAALYAETGDRDLLAEFDAAKAIARQHLTTLRITTAADAEAQASVTRLEDLLERRFDALGAETSASSRVFPPGQPRDDLQAAFRAESTALFVLLDGRIDRARDAESAIRGQLSILAVALALLSLVGSGLAMFALRRERTQWRLAHAAAEDARAKADASDIAKSRFLAVASHDMRQPLHALTLYLTALERRVESSEARDIVTKMDRAVHSMVGMFASLLDLARLQAGVIKPDIADSALQPIFDAIAAEHPGAKVDVAPTQLSVLTDSRLLERVISNLVANAVKHGGSARVSTRTVNGDAEITIADEGPGIAFEDQERIFNEFERLGARSDGLGLGLTIVRRLAELLDISVDLQSVPGEGASFILRVPRATTPAAVTVPAVGADALRGVPVLAMDDDALAREAIAGLLRDLGAHVRACANGEEAEAIVQQGYKPDLLVLDLRIEGELRGLDIAERLRAHLAPAPPVIMITGDTEQQTLEALRASGHAWLIKPINPNDLSAAAATQLSKTEA
ncbi:MAG: response regulator [Phycisphaerales bacterium]|nr:response regulator [Hyphomonadaceae bacterium]